MTSGRQKMWEAIYARVREGRMEWQKQQREQQKKGRPATQPKPKKRKPPAL